MSSWKRGAPKIAYVSGGGSGIGLCVVRALLADGATVAIFDLTVGDDVLTGLRELCVRQTQQVRIYTVDITDPLAVEDSMAQAETDLGGRSQRSQPAPISSGPRPS